MKHHHRRDSDRHGEHHAEDLQGTLFDLPAQPKAPRAPTEQERQVERVRGKIAQDVLEFLEGRGIGGLFSSGELGAFVAARCSCAPASADRILRLLRRSGLVAYSVHNRSQGLYRIEAMGGAR